MSSNSHVWDMSEAELAALRGLPMAVQLWHARGTAVWATSRESGVDALGGRIRSGAAAVDEYDVLEHCVVHRAQIAAIDLDRGRAQVLGVVRENQARAA